MGRVSSRGAPLPHENGDRITESGLYLPEPDPDKGTPVIVCQTDVAALVYNIAGTEPEDLREVAELINAAQRDYELGDLSKLLWFREPQYGQDFALTLAGVRHIVGVCRGFAKITDPFAQSRNGGRPLIVR